MPATTQRQRQAEAVRGRICAEALRQFAQEGYAGTSIQGIAEAIGLSKQALMHHFPTKQRLREAAFEHMQGSVADLVPRLLLALTAEDHAVDAVLEEVLAALEQQPHWARFILRDLLDAQTEGPDFGPTATAWVRLAADAIRRAQADGTMRADVDPEAAIPSIGLLVVATFATLLQPESPHLPVASNAPDWRSRRVREMVRFVRAALLTPA